MLAVAKKLMEALLVIFGGKLTQDFLIVEYHVYHC